MADTRSIGYYSGPDESAIRKHREVGIGIPEPEWIFVGTEQEKHMWKMIIDIVQRTGDTTILDDIGDILDGKRTKL